MAILDSRLPTGSIKPFAGGTIPPGFLACDGSAVSRSAYAALFAAISTSFGPGDGSNTFNVPDFRGRVPIGSGQGPGLSNRPLGQGLGEEAHALSLSEMPAHNHGGGNHNHTITHNNWFQYNQGSQTSWDTSSLPGPYTSDPTNFSGVIIGTQGADQPHNNMQPSLVCKFLIKY